MMTGSDSNAVAGGLARHIPVLARRAVELLGAHEGGVYVDGTFGAGGYSRLILATPGARVIGIDRDQGAVAQGATLVERGGWPARVNRGSLFQPRSGRGKLRRRFC